MKSNLIKPIANIISNPRVLGPTVFVAVGTLKTVKDYKEAKVEEKKMILLKDSAILTGSIFSFAVVSKFTKYLCNQKIVNSLLKFISSFFLKSKKLQTVKNNKIVSTTKKIVENTEYVLKEAIAGTINTFAGVLGAVYANAIVQKYVFPKMDVKQNNNILVSDKDSANAEDTVSSESNIVLDKKQNIENFVKTSNVFEKFFNQDNSIAIDTFRKVAYSLPDLGNIKVLEKPMVALMGYSVAETKGYHNKFKKTSYELLANTLIPTILVSAVSLFVKDKKPLIKYSSLFSALCVGLILGQVSADKVKDKLDKTIDSIDMKYIAM